MTAKPVRVLTGSMQIYALAVIKTTLGYAASSVSLDNALRSDQPGVMSTNMDTHESLQPRNARLRQRWRQLDMKVCVTTNCAAGEFGLVDHDPVCSCRDYEALSDISVHVVRGNKSKVEAQVTFINAGDPVSVRYELDEQTAGGRIFDILESNAVLKI